MRISLDVHGVIDKRPDFFAWLTRELVKENWKVFITTGQKMGIDLIRELDGYRVVYHHVMSVTTYHQLRGTPMWYKNGDPTQPMMAGVLWDSTKAYLCKKASIDLHIDDSDVYGEYFTGDTLYVNIKEFSNFAGLFDIVKEKVYESRGTEHKKNQLGV